MVMRNTPRSKRQRLERGRHVKRIGVQKLDSIRHHADMARPEHKVATLQAGERLTERQFDPTGSGPSLLLTTIAGNPRARGFQAHLNQPRTVQPRDRANG